MKNRIKKDLFELAASDAFNFKDPLTGYSPANEIQLSMIFGLLCQTKKLNLEKKVKLLGYREDTHILQAKSHLQVINSKREGFSRVLIEGFFYCDVVISTKVAGSVEVLDEKFLFDFGRVKEKIEDVYKNYNEYKKDFEKLKTKYQKLLTLQRVAKEYEKVYERVLNV